MKPIWLLLSLFFLTACASASAPTPTPVPLPTATASPEPSATPAPTEAPTATVTAIPASEVCSPLEDHEQSSLGDYITQPLIRPLGENQEQGHHGVDFAYYRRDGVGGHIEGTEIQSVLDGVVAGLGYANVYGNYVIIETTYERLPAAAIADYELEVGQSLYLLYAHMQELSSFAIGDAVACADPLGLVGDSGDPYFVTDPHLHLETRAGAAGAVFGPLDFYSTQASEAEKAEYIRWRSSGDFALLDPLLLLAVTP